MTDFKQYLLERCSKQTAAGYIRDLSVFLSYLPQERAKKAVYQNILEYVEYLRAKNTNPRTINKMLYGVKAWYHYLVEGGERKDHPCRFLSLKDAKPLDVQLQDLFTPSELELLMDRKERYESVRVRNQVIVSLLIYQALRAKEITGLMVEDINLEEGILYVRETPKTVSRTIKLKPKQIMLIYKYISEVRPKAIHPSSPLLLNMRGKPVTGEDISYLMETFKYLFKDRSLNAETIRQSVIANMLKEGKDLRVVQVFAGHKNISSTEKYKQTAIDELKSAINKYHPLG